METSDQMTGVIWALLGCRYNFYSYGFSKTEIAEARRPSTPKLQSLGLYIQKTAP